MRTEGMGCKAEKEKISGLPELNQRPIDISNPLQSTALPTELNPDNYQKRFLGIARIELATLGL